MTVDDIPGCTIHKNVEYNPDATVYDDFLLETFADFGCMDNNYLEFDSNANVDDGSCVNIIIEGCTNENYIEYDPNANIDDGSCDIYIIYGCTNIDYLEFLVTANTDDGSCSTEAVLGCMNELYLEYNPEANIQDNSCDTFIIYGCVDTEAFNYNENANVDDESCIPTIYGCINSNYEEYDSVANTNDPNLCKRIFLWMYRNLVILIIMLRHRLMMVHVYPIVFGCIDSNAFNFDANANVDDGSCIERYMVVLILLPLILIYQLIPQMVHVFQ